MKNNLNLTESEQKKINTLCDYLFFDQFSVMATYLRFERCFQPLFSEDKNFDCEEIFKEICGFKKKYLNYKRFVKAYLNYKDNKVSEGLKHFFDQLFNSILKEDHIGEFEGGKLTFSTRRANKNRECITMIEVLNDKEGVIHGVNIIFDEIFKNKLYPKKIEDKLSVGLEISLKILDEKKLEKKNFSKYMKASYLRDAVTHVFGTVDEKSKYITFLGFKCISGKTQFIGTPKGKSFLIGEFGKKMNQFKCQMTSDGISVILPYLDTNYRPNVYLTKRIAGLTLQDLNKDEIIMDESYLAKLKDKEEIDKYITTALIDDAHFFNFDLKDDIFGNSLKEVIRKQPKRWMRNRLERERGRMMIPPPRRFFSLNDFIQKFDEEHQRRGRFFMEPRFGLLDIRRMHRRRRLNHFGFGFEGFPLEHFPGDFPRHLSPFGPRPPFPHPHLGLIPPSIRSFSNPPFGPHYPPFMMPQLPHNHPFMAIEPHHFGPQPPFMMSPHFPHGPNPFFARPHHPYSQRSNFNAQYLPFRPKSHFIGGNRTYEPSPIYNNTEIYQDQLENNNYENYNLIKEKNSFKLRKGQKTKNKKTTNYKGYNANYSNYNKDYYDGYNYYQQGYDDNNNYGDFENEMFYYNQNYNYDYTPNIKIKSKIPSKYLRKDIIQTTNYITHTTTPCRPKQKRIEQEEEIEQEPEQVQYEQQEEEQIQVQNEQQKEEQAPNDQQEEVEQVQYEEPPIEEQDQYGQQEEVEQIQYEEQSPEDQIQYEQQQEREQIQEQIEQQPENNLEDIKEENIQIENEQTEEIPNQENNEVVEEQNKINEKKEDEDDEDILIPDEHPEETTSLEELDHQLESLSKLLENENLKEEERKKLEKLQKLYTQQKNILLDNAEEKEKKELLKKADIKLDEIIEEEKEKREKEEEMIEKLIENEIEQKADKTEAKIVSITTARNPSKIFRRQEMYKGTEPWTDPMFIPCRENLCPYNEKGWLLPENVLFTDVVGWEKYNWSRVEEILNSKNYQVFEDGISPDDIIQGSIGDCYFLSAVGSLCKFSHYIDRLFLTKERTKEHLYGVFIFLNASWKLVCIDDYLPYTGKKFRKFAFASSGGKELWVALLEKAWAKINGNYAKIGCGGSPTEVFDVLTEAYTEQVPINPYYKDYLWETMINAENKGYIMTAGTSADITNLNLDEVGLSPGHAYTVLGVMEIDTGKGVEKVVRLRNPYGNGEFNGDWSDYSTKWTPELKKKYNLVIKDDGDFYMSFDDFINYYITLGVCKLHPGYKTTTLKVKHPTQCQITKVTVPKGEVHSFLQLYQKNPRIPLKDGTKPKLVYCFLMLLDENFNYIYSVSNANMHNGIEQNLKEGTYYLVSDVNYRYSNTKKKNFSYVVTCYSQIALNLENVTSQFDLTNVLQTAVYSYCRMYVPPTKCSNGVYLYRAATNMDSIPFEVAAFENYTDKDYKVKLNVVGKGEKSFCFYADEIANENDINTIKELPKNSVAIFTILKYGLSSIFNFKYFFAPLKTPNPNNPTALRAPKIYSEQPNLQEAQPNSDPNTQKTQVQAQVQEQNQNIQQIQDINVPQNKDNIQPVEQNIQQTNVENINTKEQILPKEDKVQETITKEIINVEIPQEQNIQENSEGISQKEKVETEFVTDKNIIPEQTKIETQNQLSIETKIKKQGHPVFRTEPQILDENGAFSQYYMVDGDNLVIGLENRSDVKIKMQLIIEGAVITATGNSYALFYSNPLERKIFNLKKYETFDGEITFQFQYA